jgi:hypothetical protein
MRRILFLAAFLSALWAQPLFAAPEQPKQLTSEQWREDLRFMADELKTRHANLYHKVSRAEFDAAVADLDRRIPELQRNQIIVGMMRIAALVGDGHTRIEPRKDKAFGFRSLPLSLYWFDDGIYVRTATPDHRDLLGARVEAVGGVPIAESIRRVSDLVSSETLSGPRLFVPLYLAMPDILQALGLSNTRDAATLTLVRDGHRSIVRVPAGDVAPQWPGDTDISLITPNGWIDARSAAQPLWLQAPLDYHRLVELPGGSLYAQLNMVADTKPETLSAFGDRIFERACALNSKAIVLDLRLNQGGNGELRQGFVRSLIKAEDADTRLFVLTARGTFSASQFILDDIDRLTDAVFIGEPASSRPTGYGDAFRSTLPNSGISVRTSIKYWQSGQDMRPYTPVDFAPAYRFADYAAGRDPMIEAALAFAPAQLLDQRLLESARKDAAAIGAVASDPIYRYADIEDSARRTSMQLLRAKDQPAALALARWTAERFRHSSDAATVLALVADSAGLRAEAVKAAQTAIALDPNNRFVPSILQQTK